MSDNKLKNFLAKQKGNKKPKGGQQADTKTEAGPTAAEETKEQAA